ncbi:MAG TPA: hypothetical protein VKV26_11450 [Dehalococcoidia bacterium]|nr:hypothetical protein [Dehalococcoidia bacterium]
MTSKGVAEHPVLLVGSVPLGSAEEVFRTTGELLGGLLRRVPDGETGVRANWIMWQFPLFAENPAFEALPPDPARYGTGLRVKLRPGVAADAIGFAALGYAAAAGASYEQFVRLRREGAIPAGVRFQVSLPTPLAPVSAFLAPADRAIVEPRYEAALLADLQRLTAAIPAADLAVQWDTAIEFGVLEGVLPSHLTDLEPQIVERLVRLGNAVPAGVELGYHLCYGDARHKHFVEPADAGKLVAVANAVSAGVARPIQWVHLPVPRGRDDEGYFAPLRDLKLHPETELYLGLVHLTDGAAGTRRRMATAARVAPRFGIATECGMGRRPAETIPQLLRVHAEAARTAG